MGIIQSNNKTVANFEGLHLYHAGISNCSMRVRMTLEEKNLSWESHHIDITQKENLTEDYFSINPKGLVPTLVEDGVVIVESDDIIDHLDQKYPKPSLRPSSPEGLETMYYWLRLAPEIHVKAVKTYIYFKRMRGKMAQSDEEREKYKKLQKDPELLEFHRKSSSDDFSQEDVETAEEILRTCFSEANQVLSKTPYLAGDQFTLADIAWSPLYFTLKEMTDFAFDDFEHLSRWASSLEQRACYQKGIMDWWPMRK